MCISRFSTAGQEGDRPKMIPLIGSHCRSGDDCSCPVVPLKMVAFPVSFVHGELPPCVRTDARIPWMDGRHFTDAGEFLDAAGPLLLPDRARNQLILGILGAGQKQPDMYDSYEAWAVFLPGRRTEQASARTRSRVRLPLHRSLQPDVELHVQTDRLQAGRGVSSSRIHV